MPVLYITEQGSRLSKVGERLAIQIERTTVAEIHIRRVERVIAFGKPYITTPALELLLENNIPLFFLSIRGKLKGILEPPRSPDIILRYLQFSKFKDLDYTLSLAKTIVKAKIRNQYLVLKRIQKYRPNLDLKEDIDSLKTAESLVHNRKGYSSLRGIEGRATYHYFRAFKKAFPPEFPFEHRSKRPPLNPVNSLLSFGYTLLTTEIFSALRIHGFDPYLGIYHKIRFGRPALALDLTEEFRHPVIDMLVLDIISHGKISPNDFIENKDGSWFINKKARTVFFRNYEHRMNHKLKAPNGKRYTLRKIIELQAINLKRSLSKNEPYIPFKPP